MKVYLDDERPEPIGWVRAYWPDEVVRLLETGEVTHLALDHDLGDYDRGTGYDVVCEIEKMVRENKLQRLPEISIHTINPFGRERMQAGILRIQQLWAERHPENEQ